MAKKFNLRTAFDWIAEHDNIDIDHYKFIKNRDGSISIAFKRFSKKDYDWV